MDDFLRKGVTELEAADTLENYEVVVANLLQTLQQEGYEAEIIQEVKNKGKYITNRFSEESTRESMRKAKDNLIFYINGILLENSKFSSKEMQKNLESYLRNFYLFLEAFGETEPDKRASLAVENLQKIKIENEYDLQHLLYAVLKPLFLDIRREVSRDSGVGAVRSDLEIPSLHCTIEVKCTRKTMSLKKLTEEIEADIVHYKTDNVYFYIYDKEKIIRERYTFEKNFNRSFDGKEIKMIILQPVKM